MGRGSVGAPVYGVGRGGVGGEPLDVDDSQVTLRAGARSTMCR